MQLPIKIDDKQFRFYTSIDGEEGELQFRMLPNNVVDFYHTFTPPKARGQGVASAIVEHAMKWAQSQGYQVIPSCPYVAAWVKKHPEYQALIVPNK